MYQKSLKIQLEERIYKKVRQAAYSATLATLEKSAHDILDRFELIWDKKVFNRTGNAWTSFTIGIFYKGKLVRIVANADDEEQPTMRSLRRGQAYPLDEYYGGVEVDPENRFVGWYGQGGQWGPTLGKWTIKRARVPKRYTWEMVFIIPVSYAGAVSGIVASLHSLKIELPALVDYSTVTVNCAPAQTDIFKGVPF